MLTEFTVGNYRSFHHPQTLSMVAAPIKAKNPTLNENCLINQTGHPTLLTTAALYGANASGKSNLFKALHFMKHFVLRSSQGTNPTGGIAVEPFRLQTDTLTQPSSFEAVFIQAGKRYRYGFEVTSERVTAEWLYFVPSTKEARLFERDGDGIKVGNYFAKEGRDLTQHTRPNALFLSVVAQFNGEIALQVVSWFRQLGIISGVEDRGMLPFTLHQLQQKTTQPAIKELICRLDLGIADLEVQRLPAKVPPALMESLPEEKQQALLTLLGVSEKTPSEQLTLQTRHIQYDAEGQAVGHELFDMDAHESEGTQKLLAMAGPLLDTLQNGKILIVDELDARLHSLMTREIITLFNDKKSNPHGAQLIFNTQDTNLLDNTLLRRDQIWFVEKEPHGASQLYSLVEYKERNDKNFERGYMQGRYGAIPYLRRVLDVVSGQYG